MDEHWLKKRLEPYRKRRISDPGKTPSAVLVPLCRKDGHIHVLLTQRSHEVLHHKGQVAFPGGAFDLTDGDLRRTALRECREEIGLDEKDVTILGELDDHSTVTQFIITPFVGLIPYPYEFRISPVEIALIFFVPLTFLRTPSNWVDQEIVWNGAKITTRACFYEGQMIWGATARILYDFLGLIEP
jgi:8-oxo-dGTP pyrophosphatase MutT (NUDIX family)